MASRIKWVDIARYIGIMFVMLSHMEACPEVLRVFFSPFFLSIFFFCSGYLYRSGDSFKDFFIKKVKQLVVPWFIYSNLNIILSNIKSFKHHQHSFLTELYRNLLQIRYYDERLWFVPALFVSFIAFYFVEKHYRKHHNYSTLFICVILNFIRELYKTFMNPELLPWKLTSLPWHIDYIPSALLFMMLGYMFKDKWEQLFDKYNSTMNRLIALFIYLFVVYASYYVKIDYAFYVEYVIDMIRRISGVICVIGFAKIIKPNRYFTYVGSNTLIYFCIHNKFVTLFEAIMKKILPDLYSVILNNDMIATIFCIVFTFVISVVLIIPSEIINRYLPWTVGNKRYKASN